MQWLEDPNQSNGDNFNNGWREASRHLRNKKKEYLQAKIDDLETNRKIKNITDLYTGVSDFKKGYLPRTTIVKDEKGDLITDCYNILARWRSGISWVRWPKSGTPVLTERLVTEENW